ncbi:hypothetical protein [Streptomyces sp. NPDC001568]|uniref:hypothetical protein n=1 Tax=Streptomyces sp. NPDC001568 TaxID=3364588 RepID=UPI00368331A8
MDPNPDPTPDGNPDAPPDGNPEVDRQLVALARSAELTPALLWRLLRHPEARREAARVRPDLTEDMAAEIIAWGSARSLAINAGLPPAVRRRLAADPQEAVRAALAAAAPDDPPGLLAGLAADPSAFVRRFLASNGSLPPPVLARLAGDPEPEVRAEIAAWQPDAPQEIRVALLTDPEAAVRSRACRAYAPPAPLLPALLADPRTRREVVRHLELAPDLAGRLAGDPDKHVRAELARRHPDLPRPLLDALATDPEPAVRAAIAGRRETPPAVRRSIEADLRAGVDRFLADPAGASAEDRARYAASFGLHGCPPPRPPDPVPPQPSRAEVEALLTRAGL